jgi:hypothetical protein
MKLKSHNCRDADLFSECLYATIDLGNNLVRLSEMTFSPVAARRYKACGRRCIVNEIKFRDTGVTLHVTPKVKAGGMVPLKIT